VQFVEIEKEKYEKNVTMDYTIDMTENVLLNVLELQLFVETRKENEMKNVMIDHLIEVLKVQTIVVKNVQ
jgi:hypothetical protein